MYLSEANQKLAGDFLNGPLWSDFRRCLLARRPQPADVKDEPHVSSAKGHKRAAWDEMIAEIEKLPFEHAETDSDPFERPAVAITED